MQADRCVVISFSPTDSTRKIAETVAAATGLPYTVLDITKPEARSKPVVLQTGDLVLLAAPVYYGRVQKHAASAFAQLKGQGQPAVLLVNYGNRNYDDALLELYEIVQNAGFMPIAAGAFVSEHSFCNAEFPIAAGRPDEDDLLIAQDFGRSLKGRLEPEPARLTGVPGNRPFKPYPDFHRAPVTSDACIACGVCVELCPTDVISIENDKAVTREENCIVCQACVKGCPEGARTDSAPGSRETREHLTGLTAERRKPELFV